MRTSLWILPLASLAGLLWAAPAASADGFRVSFGYSSGHHGKSYRSCATPRYSRHAYRHRAPRTSVRVHASSGYYPRHTYRAPRHSYGHSRTKVYRSRTYYPTKHYRSHTVKRYSHKYEAPRRYHSRYHRYGHGYYRTPTRSYAHYRDGYRSPRTRDYVRVRYYRSYRDCD
jgi:hypothetical protein